MKSKKKKFDTKKREKKSAFLSRIEFFDQIKNKRQEQDGMRDGERKGEKCWSVVRLAKPFSYYMIRIKDVSIEVSICLIS